MGFYKAFICAGAIFGVLNSLGSIAEMTRCEHSLRDQLRIVAGHAVTSVFCAMLITTAL